MRSVALLSSFLTLLAWLPLLASANNAQHHQQAEALVDWGHLSSIIDAIDDTILHGVLHQLSPKFQDGVFSRDRSAIEHVHSESPAVATKLVHIAYKRQVTNSTDGSTTLHEVTTTTTSSSSDASSTDASSSDAPSTGASSSDATSTDASSSDSALSSDTITASTTGSASTSTEVAATTPSDATAVTTQDGGVVYSTYGGGLVTVTSSTVDVELTAVTSTHLVYSTASNGDVETSTSVVVVSSPITQAAESDASSTTTAATTTTTSDPSLQGSADRFKVNCAGLALLGLAGFMFAL